MNHKAQHARTQRENRDTQLELDFDGFTALRKWLTDDTTVKHLLRVIWDHIKKDDDGLPIRNFCWMKNATICREMSLKSARSVQTAIKKAVKLGYLIVFPPGAGPAYPRARNCNTFQLRFAELRDAADLERHAETLWDADHDRCRSGKRFKSLKAYIDFLRYEGVEPEELARLTPAESAPHPRKICGATPQNLRPTPAESAPRINQETNPETNPQSIEGRKDSERLKILRTIPFEVWTTPYEGTVLSLLASWWNEAFPGVPKDANWLAAVLAARHGEQKADPAAYVAKCLSDGVRENWISKAQALIKSQTSYSPR